MSGIAAQGGGTVRDGAGTGRCLLDRQGRVEAADSRAAAMLGLPEAELLGHGLWDRFPTLRGTEMHRRCLALLGGAGSQHFLFHHPLLNRWYIVTADPIGQPTRPTALELRVTDVTDGPCGLGVRIRAERLEAAAAAVGRMAHDLNNCLTVMMGNAEYLDEELAGEPNLSDAAQLMIGAGERAAALTGRVLQFARRSGREPVQVDVADILGRVAARLRDTGRGYTVEVSVQQGTPLVPVDPSEFEGAVLELGRNAREAMPRGGVIRLTAGWAENGDRVRVSVLDRGRGIEPSLLRCCVEPFVTTKEERYGVGLGLSAVYGFATSNGGTLHLESRPGGGTQATLDLPGAWTAGSEAATRPTSMGSILLVEDDPTSRSGIARLLRSAGYGVIEAGSAAEGMVLLRNGAEPTMMVVDVVLPGGLDGPAFVAEARRQRPGLPALLMSGYATQDSREAIRCRGVRLLPKPFRKADLLEAVRAEEPSAGLPARAADQGAA